DFAGIGDGFGFPKRFKVEISSKPDFSEPELVFDKTAIDQSNPGIEPQTIPLADQAVRLIRVTATRLALRQSDYIFALAELEAIDLEGKNAARGAAVSAKDSIE